MKKSDIARQAIQDGADRSTNEIARYLFGRYPGLFSNLSAARDLVRYHRGEAKKKPDRVTDQPIIPRAGIGRK